jgi:hypothetical protein
MSRKYTNQLIEMIDNGLISKDTVITACLSYMSEDEVKDLCESNDFIEEEEEYEEN